MSFKKARVECWPSSDSILPFQCRPSSCIAPNHLPTYLPTYLSPLKAILTQACLSSRPIPLPPPHTYIIEGPFWVCVWACVSVCVCVCLCVCVCVCVWERVCQFNASSHGLKFHGLFCFFGLTSKRAGSSLSGLADGHVTEGTRRRKEGQKRKSQVDSWASWAICRFTCQSASDRLLYKMSSVAVRGLTFALEKLDCTI